MIIIDIGTELTKVVDTSDIKKDLFVYQTVETDLAELLCRAPEQQKIIVAMSEFAMRVATISFSATFSANAIADFIFEQGHAEVLRIVRDDFNDLGEEGVLTKINLINPHVIIVSMPGKNKMPYAKNFEEFEKTLKNLSSELAQQHNVILLTDVRHSKKLCEMVNGEVMILPQIWEKGKLVGDKDNLSSKLREVAKSSNVSNLDLSASDLRKRVNVISEQMFLRKSLECFLVEQQVDVFSKEK